MKPWDPKTATKQDLIDFGICDEQFKFKRLNAARMAMLNSLRVRCPESIQENQARIGAWCVFHAATPPVCKCCKYRVWSKQWNRFNKTCGDRDCYNHATPSSEAIAQRTRKTRDTCLKKYGVLNGGGSKAAQEKIKQTMLQRHGVTSSLAHGPIRSKFESSNLQKYGHRNPTTYQGPLFKQYMLERYGRVTIGGGKTLSESPARLERRLKEIEHLSGMVLDEPYTGMVGDKKKWRHVYCGRVSISDLDDGKIPYCRACFGKRSSVERAVHAALSDAGVAFTRNDRKIISPFELDFVFTGTRFALEIDGVYWHQYGTRKLEPSEKIKLAESKGITLLHLWDFQLREASGALLNLVISALQGKKLPKGVYNIPSGIAPIIGNIIEKDKPKKDVLGDLYFENLGISRVRVK